MNSALLTPGYFTLLTKGWAWWVVIPMALVGVYLIVRLYMRETSPLGLAGKLLRAIRATVLVLMVLMLLQPVLNHVLAGFQAPVVIVLRDGSDSMAVRDVHASAGQKLYTAVTLGYLDGSKRDQRAEEAAHLLQNARDGADNAQALLRQAQQLLREGTAGSAAAKDRVNEAKAALKKLKAEISKSGDLLHEVAAQIPANPPSLQRAERLDQEIADVKLDAPGAAERLLEKALAFKLLFQDLDGSIEQARNVQEGADKALADKGGQDVKDALAKVEKLDRWNLMAELFDKKITPVIGDKLRIVTYRIDTDLHDLSTMLDEKNKSKAEDKPGADPDSHETDLATPLFKLAERHAQDSIAAVVLCSDGRHTTGPLPEDAAHALGGRGIPLYTLGVGSVKNPPDVCVARLDGALSVFLDETIRLTAHIRANGYKGKKCKLVLKRDEKAVREREIELPADGWLHETFELAADKSGPNVFVASIEPLENEALKTNNSAEAVVDVANDRLKVLLVDEQPRWETRYVASLLRRERKMNMDERWLISGTNMGPNAKALPDEQKKLDEYDIVVLGDVAPERLDEAAQKRLQKYVSERGGFLIMLAGSQSLPRAYASGPIADLLPVQRQPISGGGLLVAGEGLTSNAKVKLDPLGGKHEIMRVLRDPNLNEQLWPSLPELPWISRPAYAKPGATTLLRTDDPRQDVISAIQYYGSGRVLYLGSDETWRWRYKVGDRVHAVFWSQALRWGTSNRLTGSDRLKIAAGRRQIKPGESVEILARPRDASGRIPDDCVVIAELGEKSQPQKVQLRPSADSGGLYRGTFQNIPAGIHEIRVHVEGPGFEGIEEKTQIIARTASGQEGVELSRDPVRLAGMAKAGNGKYRDILDAPKLFEELSGKRRETTVENPYEVWSSYPLLLIIVSLLGLEWIVRKRIGLA